MAKRKRINRRKYTYYIDYDRSKLKKYPEDWIKWFEQRVVFILIDPLEEILKKENRKQFDNEEFTIFIGVITLICCGIQAFGGFYKGNSKGEDFKDFVKEFMNTKYKKDEQKLNMLYHDFRCGLAHGFCIEQGGFHWGKPYFKEDADLGLTISITELFNDLKQAFHNYIGQLKKASKSTKIYMNFERRFKNVFTKLI